MMLDPISSIAFEMHAGKGMFALLLGSGVSSAAKIPTGWDITLDLVRKVAALKGKSADPSPEDWYVKTFLKAPEYSELLDQLASTPTLRHKLIRPFIEPNDDHRERGERLPTKAHHAIASLIAKGFVRVVLTTNFDRLLEQALAELGVTVTVISSADQVKGMLPLVHAGPTVIKLHGDYLDTRIKNTLGELSNYELALDELLDQILDQYGLIACGWSGDWDVALKNAIDRTPSRKFPYYWATRSEPSSEAQGIIKRRNARLVKIKSADVFFDELQQRVLAVENLRQTNPLSSEIAIARLKEYLPEPRHEIRLYDLLSNQFSQVFDKLNQPSFAVFGSDQATFVRQTEQYISAVEPILPLAYFSGMWGDDQQFKPWIQFIFELGKRSRFGSGWTTLLDLQNLPATLVFYSICFGALVRERYSLIGMVVGKTVSLRNVDVAAGDGLNVATVIQDLGIDGFKSLPKYGAESYPGSKMIADVLRKISQKELSIDVFDEKLSCFELALAFGYLERVGSGWIPRGSFMTNRIRRNLLIDSWELDFQNQGLACDLCQMAALKQDPKFQEIREGLKRFNYLF